MSNQEQMVKLMEETKEVVTVNPKSKTKPTKLRAYKDDYLLVTGGRFYSIKPTDTIADPLKFNPNLYVFSL